MKYLSEYRDAAVVNQYLDELQKITTHTWTIMEICGGQTHSLVKNGIIGLLPKNITMVHGPGCPVCVTPLHVIDKAIYLSEQQDVIMCSYGDMLRVPGSQKSLLEAKANGADVRILYSPLEAVTVAQQHPDKQVVFFAVGFETTAPANALSVLHAHRLNLSNYSILTAHALVPPAIDALANDEHNTVQGFLAAGHVCAIMGTSQYYPLVEHHKLPIVITGFEPVDILQGILMLIKQLEQGTYMLETQYTRVVRPEGNPDAIKVIHQVFEVSNREWRGIGEIPMSGYEVRQEFKAYDANRKFDIPIGKVNESAICIAGDILRGKKKPNQCAEFGKKCTSIHPIGAPMVSSEGACAAYYQFAHIASVA